MTGVQTCALPIWFDGAALKRAIQINGVSGLCMMKLDVMDGMERVHLGVGYTVDGRQMDMMPSGADELARCVPVYEDMPGWKDSTVGITQFEALPQAARNYLNRLQEVCGVPIDIISTGPDRCQTIVRRHPFD